LEIAEALLEEVHKRINTGNRIDESDHSLLKGEIELKKGNPALALELLESANTLYETSLTLESLGYYFSQVEDWTKAISYYEEIAQKTKECGWEGQECWTQANIELGKVYEAAGNNEMAIRAYKRLLEIWSDADQDLPDLVDIKSRLDRIQSTPP
jgi:tetratricopeptide (TPR) repeat protein